MSEYKITKCIFNKSWSGKNGLHKSTTYWHCKQTNEQTLSFFSMLEQLTRSPRIAKQYTGEADFGNAWKQ